MSKVLFKKVDFKTNYLLSSIDSGKLGLPDMQRPFVWQHTKVKDLFDSMFKGYPVGYLLLWEAPIGEDGKLIGVGEHGSNTPKTLIIDGQQRLTSLYAVMMGKSIVNKNFEKKYIKIAFNPLTAEFEVRSAAHDKSPDWISNISELYTKSEDVWGITNDIIEEMNKNRETELTNEQKKIVAGNIAKVLSLREYPFSALEINSETNEEDVADIFIRINGQGQRLNQADFILTLISVFWEDGRNQIENFCKSAKKYEKGKPSAFNNLIEPDPVHILRTAMSYGFNRARLNYGYMLLRGRNFDTRKYTSELRDTQFSKFKDIISDVLNIQYWQDFLKCLLTAGYRSKQMITSATAVMYSYSLYLIGKKRYKVKEYELRIAIAKWFFMSQLTSRYVGSFESQMDEDLANLRNTKTDIDFINYIHKIIETELTNDYWNITLPDNLSTSSARSPHWNSYVAALHIHEAKVLFSNLSINSLNDSSSGKKSSLERHHLFPKSYLSTLNIKSDRDRNQNANYAYVEWKDNVEISDKSPNEYLDEYISRYSNEELEKIYKYHALYVGWENDDYFDFLDKRRSLMANVIKTAFVKI